MNRRAFIASIPLIPVAVKAAVTTPSDDLYRCVITPNTRQYTLRSCQWRVVMLPATHEAMICLTDRQWHEAKLRRQLAMPAPNLP